MSTSGYIEPGAWRKLWRELTKLGWKTKAATGIEQGQLYILPGCTYKGVRGKEVLVGTAAVVEYVKSAYVRGQLAIDWASIFPYDADKRRGQRLKPVPVVAQGSVQPPTGNPPQPSTTASVATAPMTSSTSASALVGASMEPTSPSGPASSAPLTPTATSAARTPSTASMAPSSPSGPAFSAPLTPAATSGAAIATSTATTPSTASSAVTVSAKGTNRQRVTIVSGPSRSTLRMSSSSTSRAGFTDDSAVRRSRVTAVDESPAPASFPRANRTEARNGPDGDHVPNSSACEVVPTGRIQQRKSPEKRGTTPRKQRTTPRNEADSAPPRQQVETASDAFIRVSRSAITEWLAVSDTSDSSTSWRESDSSSSSNSSDESIDTDVEPIRRRELRDIQKDAAKPLSTSIQPEAESANAAHDGPPGRRVGFLESEDEGDDFLEREDHDYESPSEGYDGGDDELDVSEADMALHDKFIRSLGGSTALQAGNISKDTLREMSTKGWTDPVSFDVESHLEEPYVPRPAVMFCREYPGIYDGDHGPSYEALDAAATPLGAFLHFLPPDLWNQIADETNRYAGQMLEVRVDELYESQQKRAQKNPKFVPQTKDELRDRCASIRAVSGREICIVIGLLIARTIMPNKEKFAHHWKTSEEGAISRGNFGRYMVRDRFAYITRNLHFSDNSDPRAQTDRAWKLRPVVDVLQETFSKGVRLPPVLSFDEAMLPSRSSFNKMRVYMKDKPHKWGGTKLFMLCCATSAYCIRFEIYCGKQDTTDTTRDHKSGAAAVVRSLDAVFGTAPVEQKRLIVTDRFYTAVSLGLQLYARGFYSIGTIMTNRLGFCKAVVDTRKTRPDGVPRGSYVVATSKDLPVMKSVVWWDNKPVHLLAIGGSSDFERVARRDKSGEQAEVACPRVMKDYQTFMGGVDVHDQLRLQRYSLQRALKFQKYYKGLFLGLIDVAIVNAFIVYKAANRNQKVSHVRFMVELHSQLCQLNEGEWSDMSANAVRSTAQEPRNTASHVPIQVDEWRPGTNGYLKRRQRTCKVCSLLKGTNESERGGESSYHCNVCKLRGTPVYLCNRARRQYNGQSMTCFEIWHRAWNNGRATPHRTKKRKIRGRKPKAGEADVSDESDEEDDDDDSDVETSEDEQSQAARKRNRSRS